LIFVTIRDPLENEDNLGKTTNRNMDTEETLDRNIKYWLNVMFKKSE